MGNSRSSVQPEDEEGAAEKKPSRSCSGGDFGHPFVEPNGGDEADDEVEVPPPMKPISEQLLAATANAICDESQAKRVRKQNTNPSLRILCNHKFLLEMFW